MSHEAPRTSLVHKVALSSGLNLTQQVIVAVSGVVVARMVGPEVLGTLAFAGAFVGVFKSLSDLGFGTAHIKRVSEGHDLAQCMGMLMTVKAVGSVAMIGAVLLVFWSGGYRSFEPGQQAVFYVVLATLVVGEFGMGLTATLVAFQDVVRKDLPPTMLQIVNALLRVVAAGLALGAVALAAADLTTEVALVLVYVWLLRRLPLAWPSRATFRSYTAFGAPTFVTSLIMNVGDRLDRLFLQSFAGTAAVGQYSAGMRFSIAFQFLSTAVAGLVFPSMARAFAEGRPEEASALCGRAERRLALVLFPVMLGITALSQPLVALLLGDRYPEAGAVIALGTVATIFQALTQPYRQMLAGAGKMRVMIVGHAILVGVQAVALYGFLAGPAAAVPRLGGGAPGAALGLAASSIIGAVMWRALAVHFSSARLQRRVWIHVGSALPLFAALYALTILGPPLPITLVLLVAAVGVGIHLLMLRVAGELGSSEVQFLRTLVSPRRFMSATSAPLRAVERRPGRRRLGGLQGNEDG